MPYVKSYFSLMPQELQIELMAFYRNADSDKEAVFEESHPLNSAAFKERQRWIAQLFCPAYVERSYDFYDRQKDESIKQLERKFSCQKNVKQRVCSFFGGPSEFEKLPKIKMDWNAILDSEQIPHPISRLVIELPGEQSLEYEAIALKVQFADESKPLLMILISQEERIEAFGLQALRILKPAEETRWLWDYFSNLQPQLHFLKNFRFGLLLNGRQIMGGYADSIRKLIKTGSCELCLPDGKRNVHLLSNELKRK